MEKSTAESAQGIRESAEKIDRNAAEVSQLKEDLIKLAYGEEISVPLLISKGYVKSEDGSFGTFKDETYARTDYISIPIGTYYIEFKAHFNALTGYALYDDSKVYIDGSYVNTSDDIHIITELPTNVRYVAFTDFNLDLNHSNVYITIKCGTANKKLDGIDSVSNTIDIAKNSAILSAVSQSKTYTDEKNEINVKYPIVYMVKNMCTKDMITSSFPIISDRVKASNISDGAFIVDGTANSIYTNIIFRFPFTAEHKYLFSVSMKENRDIEQFWQVIARYGNTSTAVNSTDKYLYQIRKSENITNFTRYYNVFMPNDNSYNEIDFTISSMLSSNKEESLAIKDIVICDVTNLTDE